LPATAGIPPEGGKIPKPEVIIELRVFAPFRRLSESEHNHL